jgi:ABC-type Fe3+-siderophore transport system permease subunit
MSNWTYKLIFFLGLILIALGVNFNTTLKEYSVGPLGTVFIAIGGLFFIIAMSKKKKEEEQMD